MDEEQKVAVQAYLQKTGRKYTPGDVARIPIDALIFSEYQGESIYLSIEDFRARRCIYDPETNSWLEWYVEERLLEDDIPPIYIDILNDGVALVDGSHRVTAHLIAGHRYIRAHLNRED